MGANGDIFGSFLPKITPNKDLSLVGKFRGVTRFKRVLMGFDGDNRGNFYVLPTKLTPQNIQD